MINSFKYIMEIKIYCYFNVKKFGWKYIFVKKLRKNHKLEHSQRSCKSNIFVKIDDTVAKRH
jgi:hypothetical protein